MNAKKIAEILLHEKAVFLNPKSPFTWASGIKSPIYCDNRLLISSISARKIIVQNFLKLTSNYSFDLIAGTATAGIPWASFIAYELNLPLIYVRSASKDHGRENSIEGKFSKNDKALLIEDLISTGKSSIAAANKLQEQGINVVKVLSIFSYELAQSSSLFDQNKLSYESLCTFDVLAQLAFERGQFDDETLKDLIAWRKGIKKYE